MKFEVEACPIDPPSLLYRHSIRDDEVGCDREIIDTQRRLRYDVDSRRSPWLVFEAPRRRNTLKKRLFTYTTWRETAELRDSCGCEDTDGGDNGLHLDHWSARELEVERCLEVDE
jgi:hypothetical protein